MDSVVILIRSFARPGSLYDCIASIRQFYPEIPIFVRDESYARISGRHWPRRLRNALRFPHVHFFAEPALEEEQVGNLPLARNFLVRKAAEAGFSYVVLCDDDFVFTEDTKLENFLTVLQNTEVQLCSGLLQQGAARRWMNFTGDVEFLPEHVRIDLPARPLQTVEGVRYRRTDMAWNFFMAETEMLLRHPWDEAFKMAEHIDWFLQLRQKNVPLAFTPDVGIIHQRNWADPKYRTRRMETGQQYKNLLQKKWNLQSRPQPWRLLTAPPGKFCPGDTVPRRFHLVWMQGMRHFPETYRKYWETWQQHHPDWEFQTWDTGRLMAELPENLRKLFDSAATLPLQAILSQYWLIYRHGGIVLHPELECLRPIGALLQDCGAFVVRGAAPGALCTDIFGAAPGHPLFQQLVDRIPQQFSADVQHCLGENFLAAAVQKTPSVRIFERGLFMPIAREEWPSLPYLCDTARPVAVRRYGAGNLPAMSPGDPGSMVFVAGLPGSGAEQLVQALLDAGWQSPEGDFSEASTLLRRGDVVACREWLRRQPSRVVLYADELADQLADWRDMTAPWRPGLFWTCRDLPSIRKECRRRGLDPDRLYGKHTVEQLHTQLHDIFRTWAGFHCQVWYARLRKNAEEFVAMLQATDELKD